MSNIHKTSIIEEGADIGTNVTIGPFCTIGPNVILHDNVEIKSHTAISGYTEIGEGTKIYPFCSIGFNSQDDLNPTEEITRVIIGKNNIIREYVTIQPGTTTHRKESLETRIGDNNLLMLGTHIAHDCIVGSNIIFVNNATLGGHVQVGDYAQIGGLSAVHQYVRIGSHAIIGGVSAVVRDVIPFGMVSGDRASLDGFNIVGMKRRGFSKEEIGVVKQIIDKLFDTSSGNVMNKRIEELNQDFSESEVGSVILDFMQEDSSRSYCEPKNKG